MWPAWLVLVLINAGVFIAEAILRAKAPDTAAFLRQHLKLFPKNLASGEVWQLVTFQFLHANVTHLLLNCAGLWFFGRAVEEVRGARAVWLLYLACGAAGGLAHSILGWVFPLVYSVSVVGASAGLYGMIGAFCWLNWHTRFVTPFFRSSFDWRGVHMIVTFMAVGVICMLNPKSTVAHAAHLGGLFMGLWMMPFFKVSRRAEPGAVPDAEKIDRKESCCAGPAGSN
jgi:membrane associated rhomboid family serine protease